MASLAKVVETSEALQQTRSRKKKIACLSDCLQPLQSPELQIAVSYLAGSLPQGRIGLGHATIYGKANPDPTVHESLSLRDVDQTLTEISRVRGAGSGRSKTEHWRTLLARASEREQAFLRRLVLGELRQGALEALVTDAVAQAAGVPVEVMRRAVMLSGSLTEAADTAMTGGESALAAYRLALFRPLQPMLAHSAASPDEALRRLGHASLEFKMDGARVQVHRRDDEVRVFSRNLRDVTTALPDVVEVVRTLPARTLVLDGEVIALKADGSPQPFQTTMRRFGRKLDVERLRHELPLTAFFFDCLHVEGEDLLDRPTDERWRALARAVPAAARVPRQVTRDASEAASFYEQALEAGHEGIMAKRLDAPYLAGRRGHAWLKLKSHHTLDLVVLAVEWGSGRRKGWLSNLHLGARDVAGGFTMVGKTFKGLTDELLRWQTEQLLGLEVTREGHIVRVRPELVVEVAFNDVQKSPHYAGGMALRFARVRRYRPDKTAEEADTQETVRSLLE